MRGYKVLNKGLINRYGFQYELNKKYILDGKLQWSKNGFHFCKYPEDTFRYINGFEDEFDMVEVEGSGEFVEYDDNYYGYYDMYASSEMEIIRVIPRYELIYKIVNSKNSERVKRLISTLKLNEEEINLISMLYPELISHIDYYQYNDINVFKRKLKKGF